MMPCCERSPPGGAKWPSSSPRQSPPATEHTGDMPDRHELADHLFTTFEGEYLLCRHWAHRSRCEPSCGYSGNCSRTCSLPANGLPPPTVQLPRIHLTHRHVRRCRKPFHLLDAVSSALTDRGKCGPSAVKFRDLRHAERNREDRSATPNYTASGSAAGPAALTFGGW
jgi:hypothetical protein